MYYEQMSEANLIKPTNPSFQTYAQEIGLYRNWNVEE